MFVRVLASVIGCSGIVLAGSPIVAQEIIPGEFIVKIKGSAFSQSGSNFRSKLSSKVSFKSSMDLLNMHSVSLSSSEVLEELRQDPEVEYIEPNYVLRRFVDETELAGFSQEVELSQIQEARGGEQAFGLFSQNSAPLRIPDAWSTMSSSGPRPIVAVIDSGVDTEHSVFKNSNAIWRNPGEIPGNGVDDDGNGFVDDLSGWNFISRNSNVIDSEGHGTHVAGIVLGVSMDIFASPLTGAPIQIMPLKFLGTGGSGSTSDAVSAIYYAVNMGARVINASWGGSSYSQALHDALAFAYSRGVVVVAAAGNYSKNNDQNPIYPSSLGVPSLASVAASNNMDALAAFSNFGSWSVLLSSPGVGVLSTYPGNQFRSMSGTSMAAPLVAGLAALAFREAPALSGFQIRNILAAASPSVQSLSGRVSTGGRIDALAVVQNSIAQKTTQAYQPAYSAVAPAGARDPASSTSGTQQMGGCGLVKDLGGPGAWGGGSLGAMGVVLLALSLPLVVWLALRMRVMSRSRRRHDRYVMKSDIKLMVEGREIVGRMQTISAGGLSFQVDEMLEKGGCVRLQIVSPDGQDQIITEARIVWNENNEAYGVQFQEAAGLASQISKWTRGLLKAS